ncbi:MAG TPA: hypothetical protein VGX68_20795 [Thermoanaerobaculia bacterium]|nr:hypothetical protein [Thermoanaerobaculia bacterium]
MPEQAREVIERPEEIGRELRRIAQSVRQKAHSGLSVEQELYDLDAYAYAFEQKAAGLVTPEIAPQPPVEVEPEPVPRTKGKKHAG